MDSNEWAAKTSIYTRSADCHLSNGPPAPFRPPSPAPAMPFPCISPHLTLQNADDVVGVRLVGTVAMWPVVTVGLNNKIRWQNPRDRTNAPVIRVQTIPR